MPFCTFHQNCFISTPRGIPGLERHQPDPPRPRASAPCPLHTAALSPAILRSRVIPSRRWNLVGFLRASWHAAYIRRTIHNSSLISGSFFTTCFISVWDGGGGGERETPARTSEARAASPPGWKMGRAISASSINSEKAKVGVL